MIRQIISSLERSLKIVLAVIGLASISPDVSINNITVENIADSVYVVFETKSMLNDSIMQIIDSGIVVDFLYIVRTRENGKLVFSRNYVEHVYRRNGRYYVNKAMAKNKERLKNLIEHHRFVILDRYGKVSEGSKGYFTEIEIGLSSAETPEIFKLWGNKPRIELEFH